MTARPSSSNSQSGSQSSPSDFTSSVETSPATIPIAVRASSADGASPRSQSAHTTPNILTLDLQRSTSTGRGGCWTCRLRRKKCDEQREEEGSCHTCRRLQLRCLGWGPRRPDWMRDKDAVQNYKAEIKAHLLRLGLIRGQPRSNFISSSPSTPSAGPNALPFPTHMFQHQEGSTNEYAFRLDDSPMTLAFSPGVPSVPIPHDLGTAGSSSSAGFSGPSPAPEFYESSMFTFQSASASPSSSQGHQNLLQFDTFASAPERPSYEYDAHGQALPAVAGTDQNDNVRREHIAYYFNHVRGLQYLFSCKTATDAANASLEQEPQGALSNAICALSNLHYSSSQRRGSFDASPDQLPNDSLAQFFQSQAAIQLQSARQRVHYTEHDAMAALHLVSYSLSSTGGKMLRGATEWAGMLEVASEWLTQTNLHVDENPKLTLMKMSSQAAFAVKATTCMDIFMSVTLQQPPRLLALYRRLLGRGGGYWAPSGSHRGSVSSGDKTTERYDVRMDRLTGCSDGVMLAFAEISALAHWKVQEQRSGTLSIRDLVARGQAIERMMQQQLQAEAGAQVGFIEPNQAMVEVVSSTGMVSPMGLPPLHTGRSFAAGTSHDLSRRLVDAIYQETRFFIRVRERSCSANLDVPEIIRSTHLIVQLLSQLPAGDPDSALLLPLCLAGSMADAPAHRELIRSRLLQVGKDNANVRQIAAVVLAVWQRRDAGARMVDWRDVMLEQGLRLLLV